MKLPELVIPLNRKERYESGGIIFVVDAWRLCVLLLKNSHILGSYSTNIQTSRQKVC